MISLSPFFLHRLIDSFWHGILWMSLALSICTSTMLLFWLFFYLQKNDFEFKHVAKKIEVGPCLSLLLLS
jgi:hypothetical protein